MNWLYILLFIFHIINRSYGQSCDLSCWLDNIQIEVPPITATTNFLSASFSATGIVCKNITIEDIQSKYIPPESYYLYGSGIGVKCSGDWQLSWELVLLRGTLDGTVSFIVTDSYLGFTTEFETSKYGLIDKTSINSCNMGANIQELDLNTDNWVVQEIFPYINGTIVSYIESSLNDTVCNQLNTLMQQNVTSLFKSVSGHIIPYLGPHPPNIPPPVDPGMTNLSSSPIIELGRYFLNQVIGINGPVNINTIIERFFPNGVFYFNTPLNFPITVPDYGTINLGILAVNLSGLNTWSEFSFLNEVPGDIYTLKSQTALNQLNISVNFTVEVILNGPITDKTLTEDGFLFIELTHNNLTIFSQIQMIEKLVYNLLTNPSNLLANPYSLLIPFKHLNITNLIFWMELDTLFLSANDGSIEKNFDEAISNLLLLVTSQYKQAIPSFFNGYIAGPIREGINDLINETLTPYENGNATDQTQYDIGFDQFTTIIGGSAASGVFILVFVLLCVCSHKKETKESYVSLNTEENQYHPVIRPKKYDCIAVSPHITAILSYGIPFLILGNIALFISSNTGVGAVVYIQIDFNGTQVRMPSLFTFSLTNSVDDMWHAKVYALSLLIATFSGAWPYLKLVLMLVSWTVPTRWLSTRRRENVIMVLDALGKWSLIDAYVLTLMIVAFKFKLAPDDIHSQANVFVEPQWGFYSFLLATMLSLILTHVILASHRRIIKAEKNLAAEINIKTKSLMDKKRKSLCTIAFAKKGFLRNFGMITITLLLILSIILLVLGSVWISFEFQFLGAAELALNFLSQPTHQSYSLLTLGLNLPNSSSEPDSIGIRWIQGTFFLFAFTMPLLHLCCLFVLWLLPLSRKAQRRIYIISEILNAWSAIDVFVVSVIASLLEISQFAQFIIGDRCDTLNVYLTEYFSAALNGVDKCFDVITKLDDGCWLLFGGCICYILSSVVVMRACHRALSNREKETTLKVMSHTTPLGQEESQTPRIQ